MLNDSCTYLCNFISILLNYIYADIKYLIELQTIIYIYIYISPVTLLMRINT